MTNANLPERWLSDRRFRSRRLSDSGYRSYMQALMWSVSNRTDGVIERADLGDIPDFDPKVIQELMGDDLWEPLGVGDQWRICDFATTQTSKSILERYETSKAWDRNRKAKAAAAKRENAERDELAARRLSTGKSTGNLPPDHLRPDQTRPNQTQPTAGGDE